MKLFTTLIFIGLTSFTSWAQAYQVYDLGILPNSFAANENILTWGQGNRLGDGASISYSFAESSYECHPAINCFSLTDFMPQGYQEVVTLAFNEWASVSNLSFNLVDDKAGDIVIGGEGIDGGYNILAHAGIDFTVGTFETYISRSLIHFDSSENWSLNNGGGISVLSVALHEIGHSLGLGHSTVSNSIMNPTYSGLTSLQDDDRDGIQYLYGALVSPVPEPSTYLLFLLGLVMVAGYSRKAAIK